MQESLLTYSIPQSTCSPPVNGRRDVSFWISWKWGNEVVLRTKHDLRANEGKEHDTMNELADKIRRVAERSILSGINPFILISIQSAIYSNT